MSTANDLVARASLRRVARPRSGRRTAPYLFVLPALLIVVGVVYVGIGYTGYLSTLDWDGLSPDAQSVGFSNYTQLFSDAIFWDAAWHVLVFAAITISVQMALGFAVALLMASAGRFTTVYKVIVFLPVILAPAATATAARQFLDADGELNTMLRDIGLGALAHPWLADPRTALFALAAINIWQWTGFSALLYQAALTQLDQSVLEAAQIDGARGSRIVRSVILPQLRGTHATLVIVGCIGALKTFDLVYLTTGGGPGQSTEFLTTYLYSQTVDRFHVGYGAALSVVMLVIAFAMTIGQMRAYRLGEA
jgi:raffinose/stachyose/melibiose transport system permease protein